MIKQNWNRYLLLIAFVICSSLVFAQNSLQIDVTDLRNNKGVVSIELLNQDNEFIQGTSSSIEGNSCMFTFDGLKDGSYAIRFFHDENKNKELDTNFFGIPKEGYGFSNDAYGTFGPKEFKEWLFDLKGNTKLTLKTAY